MVPWPRRSASNMRPHGNAEQGKRRYCHESRKPDSKSCARILSPTHGQYQRGKNRNGRALNQTVDQLDRRSLRQGAPLEGREKCQIRRH